MGVTYGNFNSVTGALTDTGRRSINDFCIVRNGLVLHLDAGDSRSYIGSGTTWTDLSGNGNNLTATNSPTFNSSGYWSTGATGYFTGAGTASIPIGNSPYTMIVWARQVSSWKSARGIISIGGYNTTNQSNALRTNTNTTVGNFIHYWWGNDLSITNNDANLSVDQWFMITAQFDGTTRRVWANITNIGSDTPGSSHNVTTTTVQVGKTVGTEYFEGDIAVAKIYNRALSAAEIQQNYNALRWRFTSVVPLSVEYLVVAGGGGGAGGTGGGGGAGGYRTGTLTNLNTGTAYTVTIGAGGTPGTYIQSTKTGGDGGNSIFSTITSNGGGGGASNVGTGGNGGSGGGGGHDAPGGSGNTPSTSPSQGSNGASGGSANLYGGGGGGGASGAGTQGQTTSDTARGKGGDGTASSISGSSVTYAGGGGGGIYNTTSGVSPGGSGGGGNGGNSSLAGQNGTTNRGGGGGGAGNNTNNSGTGGSGIVILKIPDSYSATFSAGVTQSLSTAVAGFKIYTITAAGVSDTVTFS